MRSVQTMMHFATRLSRVSLLLALVLGLLLLTAAHAARARVTHLLDGVGEHAMRYGAQAQQSAPQTVRLNGLSLQLSTGSTGDSVAAVLDAFHARCRAGNAGVIQELGTAAWTSTAARLRLLPWSDGVLRAEDVDHGQLACLDQGTRAHTLPEILDLGRAFLVDLDIARFGALRYVRAERGVDSTFFVTVWSDAPLPLSQAFPVQGDAPGFDSPDLPRPSDARRVLSAWVDEQQPSFHVYQLAGDDMSAVARAYGAQLSALGFSVDAARGFDTAEQAALVASKSTLLIHVGVTRSGPRQASIALSRTP